MADLYGDLEIFAYAVLSNWFAIIGALLMVLEVLQKADFLPKWVSRISVPYRELILACFVIATFQAWRDERAKSSDMTNKHAARLERVEARLAPRRLTADQRRRAVDGLRRAMKKPAVRILSTPSNHEADSFKGDWVEVFQDAGWNEASDWGRIDGFTAGITVKYRTSDTEAREIARWLARLVEEVGIPATLDEQSRVDRTDPHIDFLIGPKEQ